MPIKFVSFLKDRGYLILITLSGVLATIATSVQNGSLKFPGDVGDARWSVSIYEHWYSVFSGAERLTSTIFFSGSSGTLGFSDAFFLQGVLHSTLRLLGLDLLEAWSLTNFVFLILFSCFVTLLGANFLRNRAYLLLFVVTSSISYPFLTQIGHVQTLGYGLSFLIFHLLASAIKNLNFRVQTSGLQIAFVLLLLPALALSSWYAFVFTILLTAIFATTYLFWFGVPSSAGLLTKRNFTEIFRPRLVVATLSGFTLQVLLWLAIYFETFSHTKRVWGEFVFFAPEITDLVNTSNGDGIWANVFRDLEVFQNSETYEKSLGIPLFLFAFSAIMFLITTKKLFRGAQPESNQLRIYFTLYFSFIFIWTLILVDSRGYGFYKILWDFIPGASSIRAPLRINILICVILLLILFHWLETKQRKLKTRSKIKRTEVYRAFNLALILFFSLLIPIEQVRQPPAQWTASDFIPLELRAIPALLKNSACDVFVLGVPNVLHKPSWAYEIDAISIATVSGTPTSNGYSGISPDGYPNSPADSPSGIAARISWMIQHNEGIKCVVESSTSINIISK